MRYKTTDRKGETHKFNDMQKAIQWCKLQLDKPVVTKNGSDTWVAEADDSDGSNGYCIEAVDVYFTVTDGVEKKEILISDETDAQILTMAAEEWKDAEPGVYDLTIIDDDGYPWDTIGNVVVK